ncbi:MAG: AMP-binding protein, partial [Gemmatimonadetes bacterium]|nr:AMP-binding protein [Gemmatimonadota bacterium]
MDYDGSRPSNDWQVLKARFAPLGVVLIRNARRHPLRLALADEIRGPVGCLKALTGAIALARALRRHWSKQERVGVLLPPSVGGALVNMAAAVSGRVTVNLNYTTGRLGMETAARKAALETVVTSRQFVKQADLELPEGVVIVWLEDLAATIGKLERTLSLLLAIAAPVRVIAWAVGANALPDLDADSTIIFSSGSTGEPKGVPLSHFNVLSNVQAVEEVLGFGITDRLIHVLPFFHAFGNFMLWAG